MSISQILFAMALAVAGAECSNLLEWAAHNLILWAVRLSHGQTPRAEIRLREMTGDLTRCPGQVARFLFAFGLIVRGVVEWVCRILRCPGALAWEDAGREQIFGAVMAISSAVQDFGGDIRALPPARRKEFDRTVARVRGQLHHAAIVADDHAVEILAATTASICRTYTEDRNERAALDLIRAADPLMERLRRRHPAVLDLRRGHAGALLALGDHRQAQVLLRGLMDDEADLFGTRDPRTLATRQHYYWALRGAGRLREAEAGLAAIEDQLARTLGADPAELLHNRCKRCWTIGEQRRPRESAEGYDEVIADRTGIVGADHPDTLDAHHSKGKMLVNNGDAPAAYRVLRPLVPVMRRTLGARHPYTLESRKYLALARAFRQPNNRRTYRQARSELRRVLRVQVRRHGPDYPDTRDTRRWLTVLTNPTEHP